MSQGKKAGIASCREQQINLKQINNFSLRYEKSDLLHVDERVCLGHNLTKKRWRSPTKKPDLSSNAC